MATIATQLNNGTGFISGETVTPDKLNNLVNSATVTGIVNADISASAEITNNKFAGTVGMNAWQTKNASYTALAGDRINANTTGSALTITLPSSPADYTQVTLADHAGTWKTNNLTVARNGSNINGLAEDLVCDVAAKQIVLRYEGATIGWRVYA
jgi:hypothetical protein